MDLVRVVNSISVNRNFSSKPRDQLFTVRYPVCSTQQLTFVGTLTASKLSQVSTTKGTLLGDEGVCQCNRLHGAAKHVYLCRVDRRWLHAPRPPSTLPWKYLRNRSTRGLFFCDIHLCLKFWAQVIINVSLEQLCHSELGRPTAIYGCAPSFAATFGGALAL